MNEKQLEDDPDAAEPVCANEVCGCVLPENPLSPYCSEYCSDEGAGRGDGVCQCGHVGCA